MTTKDAVAVKTAAVAGEIHGAPSTVFSSAAIAGTLGKVVNLLHVKVPSVDA